MKNVLKEVKYLLPATTIDMGGFPVKQALPTQKVQQWDPFLLLHHASVKYSKNKLAKHQGIGPHPHRGFSPVTFVVQGEVHHRDSWGNDQIAKQGEVQWMHAGAGIVHSERPSEALIEEQGQQEIVQLWINSPANKKMIPPTYSYVSGEEMTLFSSADQKINNKLIAGNYGALSGKVVPQSELMVIWGQGKKDGTQQLSIPKGFSSMLYLIKGEMTLKGYGFIEAENLAVFDHAGDSIDMTFKEEGQFILLCGKPIDEVVTQSGPYVMNTQTEILEAIRDYQMGKFGILIEDS
ncbi:pirin family protein [Lutimonas zeaxanthinifaciens]|uniref:pirin family protein n=1 Tax=Lutimonas zeaxanthinifaciens TaxID=3060215 RepID=UPI00265CEE66|nr:pirin family protein [Lutimonas sp. YSD2104]WKK66434.1 pirin family protein [Lutimonas sp. YSD2104]